MKPVRGIKIVLALVLLASSFLFVSETRAGEEYKIKINEICSNPENGDNEWVELYNTGLSDIDLKDYTIEDGTKKPKKLSGKINANDYVVLIKGTDFSFGLNNTGDVIQLKHLGMVVDKVTYGNYDDGDKSDNAFVPDRGKSVSRIPNGFDSDNDADDFLKVKSTKGDANLLPVYSKDVIINEVVPKPGNGADYEFIEIFNFGITEVRLDFWQLDDIDGGSSSFDLPKGTKISPGGYLIYYKKETGIALNDNGDSARLIDPNGEVVSVASYKKALKGQSYSYFKEGWLWSLSLTPKGKNLFTSNAEKNLDDYRQLSIRKARKEEKGGKVKVIGVVTSLPGDVSKSYFYIQDETGGIQIYNYHKAFPELNYGDEIETCGEISFVSGEVRIKSQSIVVIKNKERLKPRAITINQVNDDLEGELVVLSGRVESPSGNTFYLKDAGKKIKIQVKNKKVNKPRLKSGYQVEVVGVVSEYRGEYRILIYEAEGVKILQSSELPRAGAGVKTIALVDVVIWALFLIVKKKQKKSLKKLRLN